MINSFDVCEAAPILNISRGATRICLHAVNDSLLLRGDELLYVGEMSEPTSESSGEHRGEGQGERRRHRRKHRRRRERERQAVPIQAKVAIVLACIVFAALAVPLFQAARPTLGKLRLRLMGKTTTQEADAKDFVGFGRQTLIIMNPSSNDWGYTTIVVNDKYTAHIPDLAKGMQFELFLKQLQGTNAVFNPKTDHVESVSIEPEGRSPIHWTPSPAK